MKNLKRLLVLFSFVLFYFIGKEFFELYFYISRLNEILAIAVITLIFAGLIYFGIVPVFQILLIPARYAPARKKDDIDDLIERRIKNFRSNKFLRESLIDVNEINSGRENYDKIVSVLSGECGLIRKKYVNRLFYSTAVSQNGFLDAVLILSLSVNMVKEIFVLYNGRVSTRDLLVIAKKVYYSILIGGSEGVEYATEEIFSKLAAEVAKSVPFANRVLGSLADGFVNAVLLTRVSLITENYCKVLYIEKDKDLYPSPSFVISSAKDITSDVLKRAKDSMLKLAKEKSKNIFEKTYNPVALVLDKSYQSLRQSKPVEFGDNLLQKGLGKMRFFKKKNY